MSVLSVTADSYWWIICDNDGALRLHGRTRYPLSRSDYFTAAVSRKLDGKNEGFQTLLKHMHGHQILTILRFYITVI